MKHILVSVIAFGFLANCGVDGAPTRPAKPVEPVESGVKVGQVVGYNSKTGPYTRTSVSVTLPVN